MASNWTNLLMLKGNRPSAPGNRSELFFSDAQDVFPGGVNSLERAFTMVGGTPRFMDQGDGAYLMDVDGNRYIDYLLAFGPLILGHASHRVLGPAIEAMTRGTCYGALTRVESELAWAIMEMLPSIELIRFVSSGTEAVMCAIRLARAYTSRVRVVRFEGHYHGYADVVMAGSMRSESTHSHIPSGMPSGRDGIPEYAESDTIVIPYNDPDTAQKVFERHGAEIAAVIVEPVACHMGVIPPADGFLQRLRELTTAHGALLIFDEVITGFRVHTGGAQTLYDVHPDLTTLGSVIGGGFPIGAYGGRREVMALTAPLGPVVQGGSMSGHPIVMTAGLATLRHLREPGVWRQIEHTTAALADGLVDVARAAKTPVFQTHVGTMLSLFFTETPISEWRSARRADAEKFAQFFHVMLQNGVYLPPSPLASWFVSTEHGMPEIEMTLRAAYRAFRSL
jgi:glutamate-1-semialdehyde 2,1-aminomutase